MTAIAEPQVEIDVEGPGLEIDAAEMDDVNAGIHDPLQPEEPVANVDDVPGAHFLREIDKIRVLHRDKLIGALTSRPRSYEPKRDERGMSRLALK